MEICEIEKQGSDENIKEKEKDIYSILTSTTNYFENNNVNDNPFMVNYFSLKVLREIFLYSVNQTEDDQLTVTRLKSWLDHVDINYEILFDLVYQERFQPAYGCLLGFFYHFGLGCEVDKPTAVKWYRIAAEGGDTFAQTKIGTFYLCGTEVEFNPEKAFYWYEKAAEKGDDMGVICLAHCYLHGSGVSVNNEKAFTLFKELADIGNCHSQNDVGYCYHQGIGTKSDPRKGFYWYQKSALGGNNTGMYNLANCYRYQWATMKDMHQALK